MHLQTKTEVITSAFPSSEWDLNFSEQNNTTTVKIISSIKHLLPWNKLCKWALKEGFTMTLNELEILLPTIKKIKKC
jgi:hypothetical protein